MKTPHVDRIAREGALFERAFHTTPICSPNRASILTGQYASRHGIIDNVARDAASHRLPNYHLELQRLGYETAHIGKWHMGNSGKPRPGYDFWVAYDGHGRLNDPTLNEHGDYVQHTGYITDIMNEMAVDFVKRRHDKPWSLLFAHKAVHPDAEQAADGTFRMDGYRRRRAPQGPLPRLRVPEEAQHAHARGGREAQAGVGGSVRAAENARVARAARCASTRASRRRSGCAPCMMAAVDEGVGMLFEALERTGQLDDTFILFLGDNGYLLRRARPGAGAPLRLRGRHTLAASSCATRGASRPARASTDLVICQDIAPTLIELAGGKPGAHIQGRSLLPLFDAGKRGRWRKSFLIEYWAENAYPWLIGMTYKAVRTERYKYIHWVNRGRNGELDELYDLDSDPYEITNVIRQPAYRTRRAQLHGELRRLAAAALGL